MPMEIQWAQWGYTPPLPRGLRFDESNGTFSGTPLVPGEYNIPVYVETDYGSDTKPVKIIVEPSLRDVYVIGNNAATWSENAEPDADGFRLLNMPKAYRLADHYDGFGALTKESGYWCCGPCRNLRRTDYSGDMSYWFYPSDSSTPATTFLYYSPVPVCLATEAFANGVPNAEQVETVKYADKVIFMDYSYRYSNK